MEQPKPKTEFLAKDCPNPLAIQIYTSTERASKRLAEERNDFTSGIIFLSDGPYKTKVPDEFVVAVNPCYNRDEVKEYLTRPFETDPK